MKIKIEDEESFNIESESTGIYILLSSIPFEKALAVTMPQKYKCVVKAKNRQHRLFILSDYDNIDSFDFGWWQNGETVWQSF